MNKRMESILSDNDKKISEADNIPAKMLRGILRDLGIGSILWDKLVNSYYNSQYSTVAKNKVAIATDKNNFNSGIAKENVTWGRFMRALFILSPVKITFQVRLQWRNGTESVHEQSVRNYMKKLVEENQMAPACAKKPEPIPDFPETGMNKEALGGEDK